MTMIKIRLGDLEKIFQHCREELPNEASGILAGNIKNRERSTIKEVLKVYDCKNELNSPTEFRIGADELNKILSEIEGLDLILLARGEIQISRNTSCPVCGDKKWF